MNTSHKVKQLIILSGKGGTGKTSLSAAFAHLSIASKKPIPAVLVDADVDAANLSLAINTDSPDPHDFWGGSLAEINAEQCTACGSCVSVCRFDAIVSDPDRSSAFCVDTIACEGCAACVYACSQGAIRMVTQQEGYWFQSATPFGILFHAELFPGNENSGKLVTLVKQRALLWAEDTHYPLVIIDGPPGIGCPVISACVGADLCLVVTEPSVAGLHDLKRVQGVLQHFRIPFAICINKANIYIEGTMQIREFANEQGIEIFGEIPFDEDVPKAMIQGSPITEIFPGSPAAQSLCQIWEKTLGQLMSQKD